MISLMKMTRSVFSPCDRVLLRGLRWSEVGSSWSGWSETDWEVGTRRMAVRQMRAGVNLPPGDVGRVGG